MSDKNKPLFTSKKVESNGEEYIYEYFDSTDFNSLPRDRVKQAYGVCFFNDLMVIGYGGLKKGWGLIGGSIEANETFEETLIREIKEESNMEVVSFIPIGYQKLTNVENMKIIFTLRYAC
ncbi:MAG: NUDIX domain-containing protein, partial [bacterium]